MKLHAIGIDQGMFYIQVAGVTGKSHGRYWFINAGRHENRSIQNGHLNKSLWNKKCKVIGSEMISQGS